MGLTVSSNENTLRTVERHELQRRCEQTEDHVSSFTAECQTQCNIIVMRLLVGLNKQSLNQTNQSRIQYSFL